MRLKFWYILVLLLLMARAGTAQVQVSLPDTTADWRGQISIAVRVSDITAYNVFSYEVTLKYDSLILSPVKVNNQNTLTANWPTPLMNNSKKGTLIVGGYGSNILTGKGVLVYILFDVIGQPNEVSNLTFNYVFFNNGTPSINTVNGRVKITTNLVSVTLTTNVLDSTSVNVDGVNYPAPYSTYWVMGSQHQISAPSPQIIGGNKRYIFHSWSDQSAQTHSVSVTQPITFTAIYNTQYYLLVQSSHGNSQGSGWYGAGTTANFSVDSTLSQSSNTRYIFTSWTGTGSSSYSGSLREASVIMNGPITETANWSTQYYVDIISPYGNPFGSRWYQPGTKVNFGIDSTIIIRSNIHGQFLSWSGIGSGSYTGTNAKATLTVTGPLTEQANWDIEYLVITGSYPDGILQVPGGGWYKSDQQFTTIKAPDSLIINQIKYIFKGWKVNHQIAPGNPMTLAINEPKTIIADYNSDITVIITTNIGPGTKVLVEGEEKNAPYTAWWTAGSKHNIGVVSVQNGKPGLRYTFSKWTHGGSQTQDVAPTTNTTYLAELETQFYLEAKTDPPGIVNLTNSGWYPALQIIKLDSILQNKITGQVSYRFVKWQVDGMDSLKKAISILMDNSHTVIAVYQCGFYISGNITFVGAVPVPIILNVSGLENFSVSSNLDGSYLLAGLLAGDYGVTLYHPDFRFEPTSRIYQITKNEEYQYYVAFYQPTSLTPDNSVKVIPDKYELMQNYPNPFSSQTFITYQLKQDGEVKLMIYNILGQVVKELVNHHQPKGCYQIGWNRLDVRGDTVPPGVYFYRIEAGDFIQIKKMIIL